MSAKDEIELLPYEDKFCEDFGRITTNWVSKLFVLEAHDIEQIAHPERMITDGGYIVVAKLKDRVVGVGALLYRSEGVYEVAKMGVDEDIRGYGIGGKIMTNLIDTARNHFKAKVLKIETSSKLDNAIYLYKKHGFVQDQIGESVHGYARADVFLTYDLTV